MGSQGVPTGQNLACTLVSYCHMFFYTQRTQILIKIKVFKCFLGVIKMHNPVNSAPYSYHGEKPYSYHGENTARFLQRDW